MTSFEHLRDLPSSLSAGPRDWALLCAALDHALDAVVITTVDLDPPGPAILYVNRAFEEMTGYPAPETLGHSPRLLQGPETDRRVLDHIRSCLHAGQRCEGEIINYRKNGSAFWLQWRITPICDATGERRYWISFQRDVSARREASQKR